MLGRVLLRSLNCDIMWENSAGYYMHLVGENEAHIKSNSFSFF